MPDHTLVWDNEASREYAELIGRRNDKAAIRRCIEGHLLTVTSNIEIARPWTGPGDFRVYDFQCTDREVVLYLRAVFQLVGDDVLAVLSCNTIAL